MFAARYEASCGRLWTRGALAVPSAPLADAILRGSCNATSQGREAVFPMDWHEPHGKGAGDIEYFECRSQNHPFHFHIPK